jgi:hypothetical protein
MLLKERVTTASLVLTSRDFWCRSITRVPGLPPDFTAIEKLKQWYASLLTRNSFVCRVNEPSLFTCQARDPQLDEGHGRDLGRAGTAACIRPRVGLQRVSLVAAIQGEEVTASFASLPNASPL